MARTLAGGRRDAKLGITPSGKSIWLEKHPSEYKNWSASDHLYAAIIHGANRTRGGEIAEAHRALAGKSRAISPADVAEAHRTGASLAGRRSRATKKRSNITVEDGNDHAAASRTTDDDGWVVEVSDGHEKQERFYADSGGAWLLQKNGTIGRQLRGTRDERAPKDAGRMRSFLRSRVLGTL